LLAGWRPAPVLMALPFRSLVLFGPLAFVVVAVLPLLSGRALLQYPTDSAGTLIVLLEIAATLSIGLTLCALFLNVSADDGEQP
ncbi:MAG: sodium:proton antiporter, partial [Pseudomonadales bacterium]